ncbi:hypothetical protein N806_23710 [Rhodococcus sp. P27]|nr:hypothetical protein N806_23710 [Rhodococcus sp. P27]
MRRVGTEQTVQSGAAGAGQPDHEDRAFDRNIDVLGIFRESGLAGQASRERSDDHLASDHLAVRSEVGFLLERLEQNSKPFEIAVAAEVFVPGLLTRDLVQVVDGTDAVVILCHL